MNIAKALKVKNRLAGEVSKLMEQVKRENSRRNDNPSTVDVAKLFEKLTETRGKLVKLKAGINIASAPAAELLVAMDELKGHMNWLCGLPTREGQEIVPIRDQAVGYQWTAFVNRERLDELIAKHQEEINKLQDQIDDFNAKTDIGFDI